MRTKTIYFTAVVSVVCLILVMGVFRDEQNFSPEYQVKTLKFSFDVQNTSNRAVKDSEFSTYLPVEFDDVQLIDDLLVSEKYAVTKRNNGNQILSIPIELIPPYGNKTISVSYNLKSADMRPQSADPTETRYLKSEKYVEANNNEIQALAKSLQAKSKSETAAKIFKWVTSNISNVGYTSQDKGAAYALDTKQGDCTEFMYLTMALARAAGIPARGVAGYVYGQSTLAKSSDYHNWAELYYDGRWHVLDTQKGVFDENIEHYVAIRFLSESQDDLLGNSHRFSVASGNLKVSMR